MGSAIFLLSLLSLIVFSGCQKVSMEVPEGFAKIEDSDELYTAVTPEGMKLSIRKEKNYPKKGTAFWGEALSHHLEEEGYIRVSENDGVIIFDCPAGKGAYIEWGVPYGGKDYLYLTGVVVRGKDLYVIQAAGPYSVYKQYQKGIKTSLSTFSL
jgi:hypothetical protein